MLLVNLCCGFFYPAENGDGLIPCAIVDCSIPTNDRSFLFSSLISDYLGGQSPVTTEDHRTPIICTIGATAKMDVATILGNIYACIHDRCAGVTGAASREHAGWPVGVDDEGIADELETQPLSGEDGMTRYIEDIAEIHKELKRVLPDGTPPPSVILVLLDVEAVPNLVLEGLLRLLSDISDSVRFRFLAFTSPNSRFGLNLSDPAFSRLQTLYFVIPDSCLIFDKVGFIDP